MISILTYKVDPFVLFGTETSPAIKKESDWLRKNILALFNRNQNFLRKAGHDTSVFHNHNEKTGQTIARYPLVVYHQYTDAFYLTAINEGIPPLKELLDMYKNNMAEINKNLFLNVDYYQAEETEVKIKRIKKHYHITNWLPFNSDAFKKYNTLSLNGKIKFLEETLQNNISYDFGERMKYDLAKVKVNIEEMDQFKRTFMQYKGHDYLPFSLEFSANVVLPDFITMGNGKACGFGRLMSKKNGI